MKLVSINIEAAKHLDLVRGFLELENPDVICMQEVFEEDAKFFAKHFDLDYRYVGMTKKHDTRNSTGLGIWGLAILSRYKILSDHTDFYVGSEDLLETYDHTDKGGVRKALLCVEVEEDDRKWRFANTHFTWTPNGQPTEDQRVHLEKLLEFLEKYPDIILCGDFNAPRGGEVWSKLALVYKDNIPDTVKTTVDKNNHIAGDLQLVVDGLFTTPEYGVSNVEVLDGLSDHCAIVAEIEKKS